MSVMPSPSCGPRRASRPSAGDRLGHELEVAVRDERHVLDLLHQPRRERRHLVRVLGSELLASTTPASTVLPSPSGTSSTLVAWKSMPIAPTGSSPSPRPSAGPASRRRAEAIVRLPSRASSAEASSSTSASGSRAKNGARTTSSTSGPSASSTGLSRSARRRSASARCRAPALRGRERHDRPPCRAGTRSSSGCPRLGSAAVADGAR